MRRYAGALAVLLLLFANGYSLDPDKSLTQYIRTVWTAEEGLPQTGAFSIVQTPDGYLWFGTLAGLVRFDGINFTVFDQSNTPELSSDPISAVYVDAEGTLWAATGGTYGASISGNSLVSYRDGKFSAYTKAEGFGGENILNINGTSDGRILLSGNGGLYQYSAQTGFRRYTSADGLSSDRVWVAYQTSDANIWVGGANGVDVLRDGRAVPVGSDGKTPNKVKAIREGPDGSVWCASQNGLIRIKNGTVKTYTTADGLPDNDLSALATDRNGNLWIGTVHGYLVRFRDEKFSESISLGDLDVWSIFEDREGNLWAGAFSRGLYRIKDGDFKVFGQPEGLPANGIWGAHEDSAGSMWIATDVGVSEMRNDKVVHSYTQKDGLLGIVAQKIFSDRENSLWIGSARGVSRLKNGKIENFLFPLKEELWVSTFYEAADGLLWIYTSRGIFQFRDRKLVPAETGPKPPNMMISTVEAGDGAFWLGTNIGLVEFKNGEFISHPAPDQENTDYITSVKLSDDGTLWLATTNRGMLRLKNGRYTRYTVNEGLFDNQIFQLVEDGLGNLWFGGNKGIFRVSRQELDDFADGKIAAVHAKVFDTSDGMRSRECNGSDAAMRDRNGNLWFPTVNGIVEIDPRKLEFNSTPPLIAIEKNIVDGNTAFSDNTEIAPGSHKFEFHYTGLSLIAPQKVTFKYILEGYDRDWVDADTRRAAFYTNLPAGNYTFKVIAANNDGVWNEQGASVRFLVLAPFWRTTWFWSLCIFIFFVIAYLAYHARISYFERREAQQDIFARRLIVSQEQERKRIAGELHDGLGQQLLIIKNRAALGLDYTEADSNIAAAHKQLAEILSSTTDAISQTREIAYALRPLHLERLGLTSALEEMIDNVAAATGISFDVEIIELGDLFSIDEQINLFRIVQESINNIVKHSEAKHAGVFITRDKDSFEIKITDDGKGFDVIKVSGKKGLGLTSIAERARILGATYHLESTPETGTMILLKLDIIQT